MFIHKIINGDSRIMSELQNESIHLIVTSPPYWQLKDYGNENQIGFHYSYENYINQLNLVWNECFRVLHKGCRLCINIGDQFVRSIYYGRYKIIPIHTEIIKFCEVIGFNYMGAIIWQKMTTSNSSGGATIMGSYPHPRNGILKIDYEFILIFKKDGDSPQVSSEIKKLSALTKEEWNLFFQGHWTFNGAKQDKHLAMFPEELPRRLIKMFSFVNETVLDPFLGSGTTILAAKNLQRNSVGYEINPDFIPIIKEKINFNTSDVFQENNFQFFTQEIENIDFEKKITELPYIFRDFLKLDKKIDVKKLQYGSKIDKNISKKEEYFLIKEILSPELVKLNNNLLVKLIGIKQNNAKINEAIEFLQRFKGKKVYFKHDNVELDTENHLLVYLYLQNKTFINAHLLKKKLVYVDNSYHFKYLKKFTEIFYQ